MPYKAYQPKSGLEHSNGQLDVSAAMAKEGAGDIPMPTAGEGIWPSQVVGGEVPPPHGWPATHPGKKFFPKKFGGVGKAFKQLPNATKKKRINFRLRKLITPKAPVMVLNEMVGSVTFNFADTLQVGNVQGNIFTAQCEVYGVTYNGSGPSKQIAKNICAEQAIQAVVAKKCQESREKFVKQMIEGDQKKDNILEDETPWAQLASLALFKLFNDWQNQGFQIPTELLRAPDAAPLPAAAEVAPPAAKAGQQPAKKVPENPTSRHPVQLLNELRGSAVFNVIGESGAPPNTTFTMAIELDGRLFKGEGRNKKDAKRNCALAALQELYSIVYPQNVGMDLSA